LEEEDVGFILDFAMIFLSPILVRKRFFPWPQSRNLAQLCLSSLDQLLRLFLSDLAFSGGCPFAVVVVSSRHRLHSAGGDVGDDDDGGRVGSKIWVSNFLRMGLTFIERHVHFAPSRLKHLHFARFNAASF
jgi:hypothetical protein